MSLRSHLARSPFIAILRGVTPPEALDVGRALLRAGFSTVEVPLNSPDPLQSIALLARELGESMLVGAGTVTKPDEVADVVRCGGRLIVMPHGDPRVIRAAKAAGAICTPGAITPTECFAALDAGADGLKLFPAELVPPATLNALRVVFPPETIWIPVGGVTAASLGAYKSAGAAGFGIGGALYKPGRPAAEVEARARELTEAWQRCV